MAKCYGPFVRMTHEKSKGCARQPVNSLRMEEVYEGYQQSTKKWMACRIIAIRLTRSGGTNLNEEREAENYEYYVHYQKLDRRNDEWVGAKRLRQPKSVHNEDDRSE